MMSGFVAFAYYWGCDPLFVNKIETRDQVGLHIYLFCIIPFQIESLNNAISVIQYLLSTDASRAGDGRLPEQSRNGRPLLVQRP